MSLPHPWVTTQTRVCLCCSPAVQNDSTEANFELADCQFKGEQQLPNCPIMELLIHLFSPANPSAVLTLHYPGAKGGWIPALCIAGRTIPACLFLPSFFPNRSQESTRSDPLTAVATPLTINRPRKLGLDSSHF